MDYIAMFVTIISIIALVSLAALIVFETILFVTYKKTGGNKMNYFQYWVWFIKNF